jgi:hypothetical protein
MDNHQLSEKECEIIMNFLMRYIKPEEILGDIHPKLRIIYEDRLYHYKDDKFDNICSIY